MPSTYSPNKDYQLQATGEDTNTWGINTNANLSLIDENLGGTLTLSVAGNSNVTLTSSQAANLFYNLTGVLTGNINVIFPAAGGFYYINNTTTGAYTLTIQAGTSTAGIVAVQGQPIVIGVDNSTSPPTVLGFIGTQYVYLCGTVTGTANALIVSQTFPSNFTLNNGTLISITPANVNTGACTLNVAGTGNIAIVKLSPSGYIPLQAGDLVPSTFLVQYIVGIGWFLFTVPFILGAIPISTNTAVGINQTFSLYVCTAALTLTLAQSTTLPIFFYVEVNAFGGNVTLTPYASDSINVNGITLAAGTSYIIMKGGTARIYTDQNGNLYINFYYPNAISYSNYFAYSYFGGV